MGALLGGIGALAGGLSGLLNPRPPSLSPVQSGALNQLIPSLMAKTQGPAQIDPTQQAALFGQINQNTVGANNAAIHSLTGAGLGRSGLLGSALIQNQDQAASSKNQADLGLQQQAVQVQQQDLQSLIQALNVGNIPGQSGAGAAANGLAPLLAYNIQNQANSQYASPGAAANAPAAPYMGPGYIPSSTGSIPISYLPNYQVQ